MASKRPRRLLPANRWARGALYLGAGLLGLWGLAWLAVPPLLKWQGEKIASEQLGRAVRIGSVDFKPWTLELTLNDVAVGGAGGAPDQVQIKRLYADAAIQSVFRLAPVLDAIQVDVPTVRLVHLGDGHYDIDDILSRLAARPKSPDTGEPARFALYNIDLNGGRIDFDDRAVGRQHEVRELHLALPFVSNMPSERRIKVEPQLAFVANGSRFDSRAETLPFDASRHTDALFRLSGLDLKPYLGYIPAGLPIRLQAATVDADLRLGFEQNPKPALRVHGALAVSGLKSVDGQGADALAFDALKLQLADVRPLERKIHLSSVEMNGPQLAVRRDKSGQINLMVTAAPASAASGAAPAASAASAPTPPASAKAAAAPPAPVWQLAIDKLAIHGGTVDFSDETTAEGDTPAALVRLNEFELSAATIGVPFERPLTFNGSAALVGAEGLTPALAASLAPRESQRIRRPAAKGSAEPGAAPAASARESVPSIEFQGSAGQLGADVQARLSAVPLALAAPYLAPHLVPHLTGQLDATLGLQWEPPKARDLPPELKIAAERLALSQLMLSEAAPAARADAKPRPAVAARAGPLASVGLVDLRDVRVDWRTRAASIGKIDVQQPRVTVARDEQRRWMYEPWLRQPPGADKPSAQAAEPARAPGGPQTDFPWKVAVAEFALTGGQVGWRDAGVSGVPVEAELTQLQLDAKQFELNGKQAMPVNLSARLAGGLGTARTEPGQLAWRGSLGLAPLAVQGTLDAERIPVHTFEPYFGDALNVDILRADTSFKGQVAFAETAQGPRVHVSGDARLEELRTHSRPGTAAAPDAEAAPSPGAAPDATTRRSLGGTSTTTANAPARPVTAASASVATVATGTSLAALAPVAAVRNRSGGGLGEELLSWKQLKLAGLDVQLEPGKPAQVEVKDTLLSDFYARLIVHPNGRINLQDVVKSKDGDAVQASTPSSTARAAPPGMPAAGEFSGEGTGGGTSAAAPTVAVATPADPLAPVIRFGPTRLVNGKVDFSDRFIRPNYSADLTELNGTLGGFTSVAPAGAPQMADLQLTGRAEGSAALEVTGKLNPLAKPLALDIHGKVRDLELPPLSPYSIKYAGHGIERGKLSMDVAYVVLPDGRLTATNKLVLNQLEFGEPVAGAPASLPVKLATALLADSKGVIDLDLPISGSLNDPQFSVGPIVAKAIVNLIGRAITAPFSLLGRALGGGAGGEDMSQVAFAPGSASLSPKAREQLDRVAKALVDRPQLKLTVVGTAQLGAEREGYKRERLKALVAAEKRGAAPAGPAAAASAPAVASAASAPVSGADSARAPSANAASGIQDVGTAVSEAEYPELLKRLYRRADLPGKPRNAIGMLRDIPVPEMEALLLASIEVGEDAMRQLAVQRGVAVKDYLAGKSLPTERLFLGAARTGAAAQAGAPASAAPAASSAASASAPAAAAWSPRAELVLAAR